MATADDVRPEHGNDAAVNESTEANPNDAARKDVVVVEQSPDVVLAGQTIERALQSLLELGICASDVQPTALESTTDDSLPAHGHPGGLVGRKVVSTVQHLDALYELSRRSDQVGQRLIPLEVVRLVDQGKNPDRYTRDFVERTAGENMFTNGVIDAFHGYEGHLKEMLDEAFPDLKAVLDQVT